MSPADAPACWAARAFGVAIAGDVEAPGLPASSEALDEPPVRLEIVPAAEIDRAWPADRAVRLLEEHLDDGPGATRSIDHAPGDGYRLFARHFGIAHVSEDGGTVRCAPPGDEPWSWQRFLVGRVLPWAAVLRGREVLHASAVAFDGRAVAFVGPSGAGKTSLATRLLLRGARLVTDDVLAVERRGDGTIVAHPGAALLALRPAELEALAPGDLARLGTVLGESGKTYVEADRVPGPLPLAALCFLARGADGPIERVGRPGLQLLLGSTFNASIRTPDRLRRQFELSADIAEAVPLLRVPIGPQSGAAVVAARIRAELEAPA
jgi:hypothetical protein